MNREVIITCALTGAGDTASKSPHVPVTPKDIAADAINAAAAGASVVHIHVRDPRTGAPSRDPSLFEEVHNRIREQNQELMLNYTGGMGGISGSILERPQPLRRTPILLVRRSGFNTLQCCALILVAWIVAL